MYLWRDPVDRQIALQGYVAGSPLFLRTAFSTFSARANHRIIHRWNLESRFTSLSAPGENHLRPARRRYAAGEKRIPAVFSNLLRPMTSGLHRFSGSAHPRML
jgi:hypothetical protein